MIDIWFINTAEITSDQLQLINQTFPQEVREVIEQPSMHETRRLKTMGRLLVRHYFSEKSEPFDWEKWSVDKNGKPIIEGGFHFNMSHSEDVVAVAFSRGSIGMDIEKHADFDYTRIVSRLHDSEQVYIENSSNKRTAFFKVWTRKEAYLKAIGKGIDTDLSQENCLESVIGEVNKWHLKEFRIGEKYIGAICSEMENPTIELREFRVNELIKIG